MRHQAERVNHRSQGEAWAIEAHDAFTGEKAQQVGVAVPAKAGSAKETLR